MENKLVEPMVFMAKENKLSSNLCCEDILQPSPKIDHFLNYRKNSKYVLSIFLQSITGIYIFPQNFF